MVNGNATGKSLFSASICAVRNVVASPRVALEHGEVRNLGISRIGTSGGIGWSFVSSSV